MKTCLCLFLLCSGVIPVSAQLIRVPVGCDSAVASFTQVLYTENLYCPDHLDTCAYNFVGLSNRDTVTHHGWLPKNYFRLRPGIWDADSVYVYSPKTNEEQLDTLFGSYWNCTGCPNNNACQQCPLKVLSPRIVNVTGFFDGAVRPRIHFNGVPYRGVDFIMIDSQRFSPSTRDLTMSIYNNTSDTVTCSDFILDVDPTMLLSMITRVDSIDVASVVIPPFSVATVTLVFATTAVPSEDLVDRGYVQMKARSPSLDSSLTVLDYVSFHLVLHPVSVKPRGDISELVSVYPNPSSGSCTITYSSDVVHMISLALFDELGKETRTIHQGMLEAGEFIFSQSLPAGMYFLRLVIEDKVYTQKIVIL